MKDKILEAALEVYLEKPNATVHEVSERAGISKSTVFYYFGSKKGLEKELLLFAIKKYAPWRCDTLEEAIKAKFDIISKDRRVPKMFFYLLDGIYQTDPEFIEKIVRKAEEKVGALLRKEGVHDEKIPLLLMALLDGIAMYSIYGYINPDEYRNMAKFFVDLIKNYSKNKE